KIQTKALHLRAAKVQKLVNKIEKSPGVLLHRRMLILDFRKVVRLVNDSFQRTLYQRQRCSYLVSTCRKEFNLRLIYLFFFFIFEKLHASPVLLLRLPVVISEPGVNENGTQSSISNPRGGTRPEGRKNFDLQLSRLIIPQTTAI